MMAFDTIVLNENSEKGPVEISSTQEHSEGSDDVRQHEWPEAFGLPPRGASTVSLLMSLLCRLS